MEVKKDLLYLAQNCRFRIPCRMNFILRLFLTFSSVSFFLIVFLLHNEVIPFESLLGKFTWMIYVAYVLIPFLLAKVALGICMVMAKSSITKAISLEASNNDFLSNYLAFFFVALSINGVIIFWVVFGMTILFTFVSRVSYFNPVFLVFGYNYYYLITGENVKIMLISKKKYKNPTSFRAIEVGRINDYTFIEI